MHHEQAITPASKLQRGAREPCSYDPRLLQLQEASITALDKLQTDLLSLPHPCALFDIPAPRVEIALHDHDYTSVSVETA